MERQVSRARHKCGAVDSTAAMCTTYDAVESTVVMEPMERKTSEARMRKGRNPCTTQLGAVESTAEMCANDDAVESTVVMKPMERHICGLTDGTVETTTSGGRGMGWNPL